MTSTLIFIGSMILYMLILYFLHEVFRKYVYIALFFFLAALFTFPLWENNLGDQWFRWVKTLSVLIPLLILNLSRISQNKEGSFWNLFNKKWVLWFLWVVVAVNITEATIKDFELGNIFNALCGIILIITMPLANKAWSLGGKEGNNDLIVEFSFLWSFLYTIWNAAFVYAENPGFLASSICILTIPVLRTLINKRTDLWMSARAYTLGVHITIRALYDIFSPVMDSSSWANQNVLYFWGLINLIIHVLFIGIWLYQKVKKSEKDISITLSPAK